jgi:citrate synthase
MTGSAKSRDEGFAARPLTRIWQETASASNPYVAGEVRCHGYDHLQMVSCVSFAATLFLLFKRELPTPEVERFFERLIIAFVNPGPRHAAVRAAQTAGAGKTDPVHILPIGLSVLGGEAGSIPLAMQFLAKAVRQDPVEIARAMAHDILDDDVESQLPGFGRRFGGADDWSANLAHSVLSNSPSATFLRWGCALHEQLADHKAGWLRTGVFAAALLDLGFPFRAGAVLYQLLNAPGIAAQGLEMHGLPRTAMPFLDDAHYFTAGVPTENQS